jgi:Tfp pilus assembly protein PilF
VDCHAKFYDLWSTSHHGLAMQVVKPELLKTLAPQPEPLKIGALTYQADLSPEAPAVIETGPEGTTPYPIVHALGGKNVFYFLTELERGRLQVLPLAYDVHKKTWYDVAASGLRHFEQVRDDIRETAVHWKDYEYTFNTSCHGCHVSQVATNYDLASDTYHTTWVEPGINCETCHGPAEAHVAAMLGAKDPKAVGDIKLFRMGKATTPEQNNAICASCHAKAQIVTGQFKPGEAFFDHFGLVTLENPDFYPDGRDLGENYTLTSWMMNPCSKGSSLQCLDCHTSSGRSRFPADQPNQNCASCHQDIASNSAAHSHHAAGSAGDSCVACHMPTTRFAAMMRSDHSMLPPAPAATMAFKSPNACNMCHADKDAAWADRYVREWYPRDYQKPVLERGALVDAARKRDWTRLSDMTAYVQNPARDEITANALVRLLADCPDDAKWPAIEKALTDPSPLIRSSAAETLAGHLTPETIGKLLVAARDPVRLVRTRVAGTLSRVPADQMPPGGIDAYRAALAELEGSMRARPDDPMSHANLGNLEFNRGHIEAASTAFDRSLKIFPDNYPALVNAALAYSAAGRNDRAESSLRHAIDLVPENGAAHFNLGLLLAEMNRFPEAEASLRQALKADPSLAAAAYNLAVIVAPRDRDEAVRLCRQAATSRPSEPRYAFTLAFYQAQSGSRAEAVATLERLLRDQPGFVDAYFLLGQIHESAGRQAEASAVYQRALARPELSAEQRAGLEARLGGGTIPAPAR